MLTTALRIVQVALLATCVVSIGASTTQIVRLNRAANRLNKAQMALDELDKPTRPQAANAA